ncbi:hypothetical protein ACPCG0_04540 [Propionibacteriaceae bacterium Y1923]|uniref:hypothetical protein n=1 Tax=Aestuariimicrobium sp. Y1814 TaxID=3418742 RepID=UPI003C1803E4
MSYYTETARPDMIRVSELMDGLATDYESQVKGATGQMGALGWPLMMFFCVEPYNQSLRYARDAAEDVGASVTAMSTAINQIVEVYRRLEDAAVVR